MADTALVDLDAKQTRRFLVAVTDACIGDRLVALLLLPPVLVCLGLLLPVVLLAQGRPFLFFSERMATPDRAFNLLKIRTMYPSDRWRCSVLGGDMCGLVTPVGRILRRFRLDELPQIFNILKGDMRFIGPRPPLRRYVEAFPDTYRQVLVSKPGVTGLATVMLHRRENRILSKCKTSEESDRAYRIFCVAPKARLDLLYQRRRSFGLDALIIFKTFTHLTDRK